MALAGQGKHIGSGSIGITGRFQRHSLVLVNAGDMRDILAGTLFDGDAPFLGLGSDFIKDGRFGHALG